MSNYSETVIGSPPTPVLSKGKAVSSPTGDTLPSAHPRVSFLAAGADYLTQARPFFVRIQEKEGGILGALAKLDEELKREGRNGLVSHKKPWTWVGRTIEPGQCGLYDHGGLPKIIVKPGRYPGLPFSNWWARHWRGITPLSSTVLQHAGLIAVQVSQNQAAVIASPANDIFVVKHGGFASISIEGNFRVLGVVDRINLRDAVYDPLAGGPEKRLLGWRESVTMQTVVGGKEQNYVVATFLNIQANTCCILQRGEELEVISGGQHVITNPQITIRGWFTLGEAQLEMPSRDMYTRDQVPVELRVYLRWQLLEPLKLCSHGYDTPYAALKDKALSVLTQIVAHLEYSSMIKQRSFNTGDDAKDGPDDTSSAFLDALRTRAMDELHEAALEYGILLKDLAVIDRKFKGAMAQSMDALTARGFQAQVEAANVERENLNRLKKEEGTLEVARVQAQQRRTEADAQAYAIIAQAKARGESVKISAEAEAAASLLRAKAEAQVIGALGLADGSIVDNHARQTQLARVEVSRIQAFGNKTMIVPAEGMVGMGAGYAAANAAVAASKTLAADSPVASSAAARN